MKNVRTMLSVLIATAALAQVPVLNQASLNGKFHFVYGAYERSRSGTVMGSISFDGAGKYSFSARSAFSDDAPKTISGGGSYRVNSDGTGWFTNPLDPLMPPLGLRLSADLATLAGSTIDSNTTYYHDILLAVQAPTRAVTMADFAANFNGLTFLYSPGPQVVARSGFYRFAFDDKGGVSSSRWTYHQSDQNGGAIQETSSSGAYGLSPDGTGFYTSVQGRKTIALSADRNIYIGTDDATGQEIIFGVREPRSVPGDGLRGRYHWIQISAIAPGGGSLRGSDFAWSLAGTLCGFESNGLKRANGWALFTDPPTGRVIDMAAMTGPFTIRPDGSTSVEFGGPGTPTVGAYAQDGKAFPWVTVNPGVPAAYILNIAFPTPSFAPAPAQTVYLDPNGARHHSTLSPHPLGFAPGQLLTLSGQGLATTTQQATGVPLQISLRWYQRNSQRPASPAASRQRAAGHHPTPLRHRGIGKNARPADHRGRIQQ